MSNKVTVILDGRRYRLAAEEDADYMLEIAEFVNRELERVRSGNQYRSGVDCATLAALNLADTLYKERANTEDLRAQLKQALDDTRKAEQKLRDYKRAQRTSARGKGSGRSAPSEPTDSDE